MDKLTLFGFVCAVMCGACGSSTSDGAGGTGGASTDTSGSSGAGNTKSTSATSGASQTSNATTSTAAQASTTAQGGSTSSGMAGAHCPNPSYCEDSSGYWCSEITTGGDGLAACVESGGKIESGPCPEKAAAGICVFDCIKPSGISYIGSNEAECEGMGGTYVVFP